MASFFKRFLFEEEDNPRVRTRVVQKKAQPARVKKSVSSSEKLDEVKKDEVKKDEVKKDEEALKNDVVKESKKDDDLKNGGVNEDVKVISITKAKKKQSGWNEHVAKYKREHPELKGSELFKQAKKQYNKDLKK